MIKFFINIFLMFSWIALTGEITLLNFFEGFVVGFLILYLTKDVFGTSSYFAKLPKAIYFIFYFLWELFLANLRVAYEIITPQHRMKPGIFAYPLDAKTDFEITLLANIITLTPGTLSLDVSDDRKFLYVHAMYLHPDIQKNIDDIKNGFELKMLEILR